MIRKSYFYGFKNIETGLFKRNYRTIRYKSKPAVFRTIGNAEKAFEINKLEKEYTIEEMVEIEANQ